MYNKRRNSSHKNSITVFNCYVLRVQKKLIAVTFVLLVLIQFPALGQDSDEPTFPIPDYSEQPFFVNNAIEKLGAKFPFDILGDEVSEESGNECPNYTFYGTIIEACFISTTLNALKIPAQLGIAVLLFWRI